MPRLSRRALFVGVGSTLGTLALPSRSRAAGSKVLLAGGSTMADALGKYLETALQAAGYSVSRRAKSASGLARPDFFDWQAEADTLRTKHQPAASIVMFGGNDGQGLWMGKNSKPSWIKWGDAAWETEYARRVNALADSLAPSGEHIFWMGVLTMRSPKLNQRIQTLNAIYESEMAKRTNAHFLDLGPMLEGANGGYSEYLRVGGKNLKVRTADGVHLTMSGAKLVAAKVTPRVVELVANS